jgi:uncharacterized surface protein with fasciclin (FAS1) repeats
MNKQIKITWLAVGLLALLLTACGDNKRKNTTTSTADKIPVVNDELSDLAPDMNFNDAISVLGILQGNIDYDTFYKVLKSADMIQKLDNIEDVTIFAPTNSAFERITDAKLAHLKTPEGEEEMRQLLNYHLVEEEYDYETLKSTVNLNENLLRLKTFNGGYIALTMENEELFITDEAGFQSKITKPDQEAENGVVHRIDAVLLAQ